MIGGIWWGDTTSCNGCLIETYNEHGKLVGYLGVNKDLDGMITLSDRYGDFDLLVRKVIDQYGCIVDIYGVKELTANFLIESASEFYSISNKFLV